MALVKYNNNSISSVTALGSLPAGGLNLITTNTISSGVSSSDFTSSIDSTYDTYLFKFINMHPATATAEFQFQGNADGESGFNETMTTSLFQTYHYEDSSYTSLNYRTSHDQAQGTAYQSISDDITNDADGSCSGYLYYFHHLTQPLLHILYQELILTDTIQLDLQILNFVVVILIRLQLLMKLVLKCLAEI